MNHMNHSHQTLPTVVDLEVTRILELRESRIVLKKRLSELEEILERAENSVINMVERGEPVSSSHLLKVKTVERHFPSWREEFTRFAGIKATARVLANTPPQIYKVLVIKEK